MLPPGQAFLAVSFEFERLLQECKLHWPRASTLRAPLCRKTRCLRPPAGGMLPPLATPAFWSPSFEFKRQLRKCNRIAHSSTACAAQHATSMQLMSCCALTHRPRCLDRTPLQRLQLGRLPAGSAFPTGHARSMRLYTSRCDLTPPPVVVGDAVCGDLFQPCLLHRYLVSCGKIIPTRPAGQQWITNPKFTPQCKTTQLGPRAV